MPNGLTVAEHQAVAVNLKRARDCLVKAGMAVACAYGERDLRALAKATSLIDRARGRMEARLYVEHPAKASPAIYYPAEPVAESGESPDA